MNIFTKKYFIVLFILPFIGINVIDDNILLSSASKMVVSIIGYLMLFENFNYNKNILNIKLILLVMLYTFIILFSAVINNNITMGMIYTNFVYIGFIIYINYCMKDFKNFINALNILFTLLIIYNLILAIFVKSSYMYIGYQGSQKVFVGTFESRNGISMVMIPAIAFILIRSEYIYEKVRNKDILLCFMVLIIILLSKSSTGFIVGSLLVIYVLLLKKIKIKLNINKLMSIYTIIYTQVVIFRIQETVFRGFIENTLQKTQVKNLDLCPSNMNLAGAEVQLVSMEDREYRLKTKLNNIRDKYDFIIIDCPPSLGLITLNAFTASNSVLIPVQCEYYALEGLGQLLNTVELVRKHMNKDFKVEGALLTMYDARTNLSNQVVKEVKRYFEDKVYKNVIPRNVKLSEAPSYGMPITLYDPRSKGAKSYEKFTREFLKINEEEQKAAKHMKKGE